jgi:hypothetical protein
LFEGLPKLGSPVGVGPFSVRPDLTLVARHYLVDDKGTNPDLAGANSYNSLGFDGTVSAYWAADDSFFASFVFKAGYVYRQNSNGVADIVRRTAGLSFTPLSEKNFSIEVEFARGRDEYTLQLEDRWTAGIGVRF